MNNQTNEQYIIELIREGKANKEIADIMHSSVRTIESRIYRLMKKHHCRNRVELAIKTMDVSRGNV